MALFARARARPCSAACSSAVRSARSSSPSTLKLIPLGIGVFNVPFGPFTSSSRSWTVTVTPFGTAITFFPIRDISLFPISDFRLPIFQSAIGNWQLIYLGQQFATDILAACCLTAHQSSRRRDDVDAVAAEHLGNLTRADIHAPSRCRDTLQVRDRRRTARVVTQKDSHGFLQPFAL